MVDCFVIKTDTKRKKISTKGEYRLYRKQKIEVLKDLLGEKASLPQAKEFDPKVSKKVEGDLIIESRFFANEGTLHLPTVMIYQKRSNGRLPVTLILDGRGKDRQLQEEGPDSPKMMARKGQLVVLPDVRFFGELSLVSLYDFLTSTTASPLLHYKTPPSDLPAKDPTWILLAWWRSSILWGRPFAGMACSDIRSVLDGLAGRRDADMKADNRDQP